MNIFFYSNNSDSCKVFITLMQGEGLLRFFHQVCVDGNKDIPQGIRVPGIMIKGMPKTFMGEEAFAWFSRVKQWRINAQMKKISSDQQKYLSNINSNLAAQEDNILGFSPVEMEGLSDMFAYLDTDSSAVRTYYNYDKMGQGDIDIRAKIQERKMTADQTNKTTKELENQRRKQDELLKTNIDNFRKQYTK